MICPTKKNSIDLKGGLFFRKEPDIQTNLSVSFQLKNTGVRKLNIPDKTDNNIGFLSFKWIPF
mgnify:FL=1